MKTKKYVYLAGPIRVNDDFSYLEYDVAWRNEIINHYYKNNNELYFYNPINVNLVEYCKNNKVDYLDKKTLEYAFVNDMRMILSSDVCIANIIPFSRDDYPCFGTISEIGMFIQKRKNVIILCEEKVKERLTTNPIYINCKLCTTIEEVYRTLDEIVLNFNSENILYPKADKIFSSLIDFEDPFLQNKHNVDHFDDDIIILHNVKLRMQTVYKALYRRKIWRIKQANYTYYVRYLENQTGVSYIRQMFNVRVTELNV